MYLSLPDVKGDVAVAPYSGWITVESYSWGGTNSVFGTGSSAGKVSYNELRLATKAGRSTVVLFKRVASGMAYPTVRLVVLGSGGDGLAKILEFELTNAEVASLFTSSGLDQVSFIFDKMTYQYREGPPATPARTPPGP